MSRRTLFAVALAAVMMLSVFALPGMAAASATADGPTASITDDDLEDEEEPTEGDGSDDESDDEQSDDESDDEQSDDESDDEQSDDESDDEQSDDDAAEDNEGLEISVEQNGDVIVTVTDNETAVSNATVDVSTVEESASYADEGTYTTEDDGTVSLDAPFGNESVEVAFNTTVDNESVETTKTLEPAEFDTFGALVSAFVGNAQDDTDGPLGLTVANFVLEHNPGNAPDHAGPPSHAGPPGEGDETKDTQGPPAHAGGPPGEADDAKEVEEVDEDAEDDEDAEGNEDADSSPGNGGGPPSDAGPN